MLRKRALEAEMAEELQVHLDGLIERNLAEGMSPEEARRRAQLAFGGAEQLKERCREERTWVALERLVKDARFALRSLLRARAFTLTVILTLVLGIGTAVLVYALTAEVLFFDPHPGLYQLGTRAKSGTFPYQAAVQFEAYLHQTDVIAEYAAATTEVANVVVNGEPSAVNLVRVARDCFRVLEIRPRLGRDFRPEECKPGADQVVIVTDLFWRQFLHGSADAIGKTVLVNQIPCTVIGVLPALHVVPPGFGGDVFRPTELRVAPDNPLSPGVFALVRLRSGVSPTQAEAALATVKLAGLPAWANAFLAERRPVVLRSAAFNRPETQWIMMGAAALLFLMAALNAANLMLVRLLGRGRELSIRLALGGTRGQIARLLLFECLMVGAIAGAVIVALLWFAFPFFAWAMTQNVAVRYMSFVDAKSLGCVFGLTVVATGIVALAPVWRLGRSTLSVMLKDGGAQTTDSGHVGRVRHGLIVVQAALAVVLLAGTGLMARSLERLQHVNLGFDPTGRVKVSIAFPPGYDATPERRLQLFERLRARLLRLPGVQAASFGQDALLVGGFWGTAQVLMPDGHYEPVAGNFVSADFLQTSGMHLKRGRWISAERGRYEAVVNEAFAKARFGTDDVVGKSFRLLVSGNAEIPIIGVVADVKETVRSASGMTFYVAAWLYPLNLSTIILQTNLTSAARLDGPVRKAIYAEDPSLITPDVAPVTEFVQRQTWLERYAARVLNVLSALSLLLAVVGLFSVIAYTVDSRMREFGVRMALGAEPMNLHRLVLRRGLATLAVGVALGVAAALALTRFMQSLLFETAPYDPLVYVAVAIALLLGGVAACWLPARRAARVDVVKLLRTE